MAKRFGNPVIRASVASLTLCTGYQLSAEPVDPRPSLVSIEQIGNGNQTEVVQNSTTVAAANRAHVSLRGDDNGTGTIAGRTVSGMVEAKPRTTPYFRQPDGDQAADLVAPSVASGVVRQEGSGNLALVSIGPLGSLPGDDNDFHISQHGSDNGAAQIIRGSGNASVILQGQGALPASGNAAVQVQAGAGNYAFAAQHGDGNIAKQLQAGSGAALSAAFLVNNPEAALAAVEALDGGMGNTSLIEQNGDDNIAITIQAGTGNQIGLRQPGAAFASVTQIGNGHSVAVEQMAGVDGVTPITIIQMGR